MDSASANKLKTAIEQARTDFTVFKAMMVPNYERAPHLDLLDGALMNVARYLENGSGGIQRLIVEMPPRHGKSSSYDTQISMYDGSLRDLGSIRIGERVISMDVDGNPVSRVVTETFQNGMKDAVEIELYSGKTIRCAKTHPFKTIHGWIEAGELKVRDALATFKTSPSFNEQPLPYGLGSVLGYIVGDGCNSETVNQIVFTTADDATVAHLSGIMAHYGWRLSKHMSKDYQYGLIQNGSESGSPTAWIRQYMPCATSHDKRVPKAVFTGTDEDVADFLAAYFNCDGTVTSYREGVAEYYSVSKELLEDVQFLLKRFGIWSTLRKKTGRYNGEPHASWRLRVSGQELITFADAIPVVGKKGDKLRKTADAVRGKSHYPIYECVPNGWQNYITIGKGVLRLQHGIRVDKKYKYGTARHIVEQVAEIDDNPKLRELCNPNVQWDFITDIRDIGQIDTYDIEVSEEHNYSMSGTLSHNSLSTSELFPAWLLGRYPWVRIILVSYAAALAERNSKNAKDHVESYYYQQIFPNVKLRKDKQSIAEWDVIDVGRQTGGVIAAGMTGRVTGFGANLIIYDDLISNRIEAENPVAREQIWERISNDLRSRFNMSSRAAEIMIATRWHLDDPTGRFIEREGGKWRRLRLPAIAEENDILGRQPGEALWPARWPAPALQEKREEIGEYAFSSLYQQRPYLRGDRIFEVDKILMIEDIPPLKTMVRYYDLAITTKKRSDYTVGLLMGIDHNENVIVLDVVRRKVKAPDMLNMIYRISRKDSRWIDAGLDPVICLEDEKQGISQLDYLMEDPRFRGFTLKKHKAPGDKVARASGVATRVEAGRVRIVKGHWNNEFLEELAIFDAGAHDDQVDAFSGAYNFLSTGILPKRKIKRRTRKVPQ